MTWLGWLLILLFVGGLGLAFAIGLMRTRGVNRIPGHDRDRDEATRDLYRDKATKWPPD